MLALLISMFTFSLSMSISPGPVNIAILSSSMNYGFKRTFAFISGATIGFTLLLAAVCFGLYQIIVIYPILLDIFTVLGTLLLVWIGWNIFRAKAEKISVKDNAQIPTFMQGALLQWLNPKAWIAAVAGTAIFSSEHSAYILLLFVLIYFVVCYLSLMVWGIVGEKLAVFLNQGNRAHIFNMLMGIVLIMISLQMCWGYFHP
ncbi:LysE family translocator [Acinetobacter gerneri]|nr:LysE family translocator [Acinetobacter gerneri]MDV2439146.1 LysE family translocator [Acinetobacter gerneri]